MVEEGDRAPQFSLASSDGKKVDLKGLRGEWVVVYFYPKDDTPGCTREACDFRDDLKALKKAGAVVLGVSPDDALSHEKFRDKFKLPFPLLSDPDKKVATAYGAWGKKVMYGRTVTGMIRSTFVIDPEGVLRKAFRRVRVEGHSRKVLESLQTLRAEGTQG